ncbi:MAG TPA: peptide ABC transporter substrate-binding protein [Steroidobacteraceae bacterium]|jgi:oligopeptide transport system substrate-binding protein|nr:peptide ABC transporter substrate-binding protein [Steroidobacteraceae bacterium]
MRAAASARALVIILSTGVLVACSGGSSSSSDSSAPHRAVLMRGNGPEPDSLDPQRARAIEAQTILRDVCEGLTTLAKDAGPAPGVAEKWDISADGKTYTFTLRDNAKWSNGDRVVAADFVAGLRRLVDPATASQYAQIIDTVVNASDIIVGKKPPESLGVSAPNDSTVVLQLVAPTLYLPALLAHPSTCPVHRPTLAAHPNDVAKPGVMVSNGAFTLKEWVQGLHIVLERNHNYWNDAATHLDGVEYFQIADENAELTRYRADQLQVTAVVPRGQFDWIKANLGSQLHVSPQLTTYYYGFNLERAPFKDRPGLRRALSEVIDRERLAQMVLRVGEIPAYGWVPPGVHNYTSQSFDYASRPLAERIAEAKRLYAQAGYSAEKPLHFELRYNAGEVHERLAVAIASMWKETLGVEVQLSAVEFKSLLQDIDRGDVEMFRSSWVGDYNDAYTFLQYLKSDFGINLPRYKSSEYDALLARAAAEVDESKRRLLLQEAERVALRDHALLPLYFYVNKRLVKPEVEGWYDNVMNVVYSKDLALRTKPES